MQPPISVLQKQLASSLAEASGLQADWIDTAAACQVTTKMGERVVIPVAVSKAFWDARKEKREQMGAAGLSVSKKDGQWSARLFVPPDAYKELPAVVMTAKKAAQEAEAKAVFELPSPDWSSSKTLAYDVWLSCVHTDQRCRVRVFLPASLVRENQFQQSFAKKILLEACEKRVKDYQGRSFELEGELAEALGLDYFRSQ